MRYSNLLSIFGFLLFVAGPSVSVSAERDPASSPLTSKIYSMSTNGATAENAIRMIGQKAGVGVEIDGDLSQRVSYEFANTTLENALSRMASDVGFEYSVRNNVLYVSKTDGKTKISGAQSLNLIELKYVDADEMAQKVKTILKEGEEIHVDRKLNSLVVSGTQNTFLRVKKFIELFDRMPKQILIEAKIVEMSDTFSREIGFLSGDQGTNPFDSDAKVTGYNSPRFSTSPVFGFKYKLGTVNGRNLDLRLLAAEAKGDAKVISRPKVVTINNTRALINSGLIFTVKTLSTTTTTSSTGGSTQGVAGGLERVEAGLQLGVLPTIVDNSLVKLLVDVNNSEPDTEIAVDNIPSISSNSANTSIIVEDGSTAVIAGLIKNSNSKARSGTPFLSDIPVLGLLFRTDNTTNRNKELMIFITPTVLESPNKMPKEIVPAQAEEGEKKEVAVEKSVGSGGSF